MNSVVASKHEWRRRYAMAAMQGVLANPKIMANESQIVKQSFLIADTMIAFEEREHEEDIKKRKERAAKFDEGLQNALRDKETQESKGV